LLFDKNKGLAGEINAREGKAMARKRNGKANNGKVTFPLSLPVQLTKNFYKVTIPGGTFDNVRWNQSLYLPGQKAGKGLRKFRTATITITLE